MVGGSDIQRLDSVDIGERLEYDMGAGRCGGC